ncbi:MAG TPA: hypothetical protein EYG34_03585 [Acidimicrobiia bacterium]|jgi:8-oxo-dGTP diphosphatase|nr:hypothetical protein [Acidimicrobiia bacterium]HIL46183.1 hypothetical protein [Acidimicrobiia bacterium]
MIYLIRHASAGDRYRWDGDDVDRPLDDRGQQQAADLAEALGGQPITQVLSSRAVRCQETVGQLANQLGLTIGVEPDLFEGAHQSATALVKNLAVDQNHQVVLCSHGDVIPEVLRDLIMGGLKISGGRGCAKASLWALSPTKGQLIAGHYYATAAEFQV